MKDIKAHMRTSTHAMITTKTLMQEIVTTKLDLRKNTKSNSYDFVVAFDDKMTQHNKQQRRREMHINDFHRRAYLPGSRKPGARGESG